MSKLYVRIYGLDRNVSPEERISLVKNIFAPHIELQDDQIQLIQDRDYGGYRNFCFVICEEGDVARLSDALNETTTEDGYELTVNEAKPLEDRKPFNKRGGSNDRRGPSNGGGRSFPPRGDRGSY
jgi:hypothetical protein